MRKAEKIVKNLTLNYTWIKVSSIEEGVKKLKDKQLEVVHIYIEPFSPKLYPPKKKYFNIWRVEKPTKLDEWIYKNLVKEDVYRKYLDKYLPLKEKLRYDDVDEYILSKHYRPKAIKILSKTKKSFNLKEWTRKRFGYRYERKSNLILKEGIPFRFDFRNILESLFILKNKGDKQILARGGGGSSGQRMNYTLFTAIFYLLGKEKRIKHHLIKYNSFNEYEYIATYHKPIITFDLGSNYLLDEKLKEEIRKNGISWRRIIKPVWDFSA